MYLTFKRCAELAGVKESTARFYRDTFPEFFDADGEGRKRQYSQSVVEVLRFISEKYSQNLTQDHIQALLEEKYGVVVDIARPEIETQELGDTIIEQMKEAQTQLLNAMKIAFSEELKQRDEAISRLEKQQEQLIEATKTQEKRDQELMKVVQLMQERNAESWLDKLLKPFRKR